MIMRGRKAEVFVPHLERYVWALPYCQKKRVMDAGAKDGYGANLLSGFASSVTLVDRNERWLFEGKRCYNFLCKTDFVVQNFDKSFPEGQWDVVVAFEVIEHVADPID